MQVKTKEDRQEQPEECDNCRTHTTGLTRHYHNNGTHNVSWLCKYCEANIDELGTASVFNWADDFHIILDRRSKTRHNTVNHKERRLEEKREKK